MHPPGDLPYINQLPPKLIRPILLEDEDGRSYKEKFSIRSVCRFWQEIVNETPQLWTQLSLSYNVNLLSLIIKNSKSLPLSVWYDDGYLGDDQLVPQEKITEFLSRTAMSSDRWKSLTYRALYESNHSQMLGLPLHNLQSLNISLSGDIAYTGPLNAPNLKNISVHRCSLDWSSISRLRSLVIYRNTEGPTVEAIKTILKASPDLEHLGIHRNWTNLDVPVDPTPIVLPKLYSMHLSYVSVSNYTHLLNLIVAPNLRTFSFNYTNKSQPKDFTPIFEAAGRFLGSYSDDENDSSFTLAIKSTPSKLYVKAGDRSINIQNFAWPDDDNSRTERLRYTSAALKGFGAKFCNAIKTVRLQGSGNGELGSYCHLLHSFLPGVQELGITACITGLSEPYTDEKAVMEILGTPSSLERGGIWLLPNLVTLRFGASMELQDVDIPKIVEARRAVAGAQSIKHIIIEEGSVNRAVVDKLQGFVERLELVDVEII
ncbi:hypothetical protein FRC04_011221 [Tulasnella sp. 424]|nr:hypothetical protein FRC04_011221 [Tulasnella sp. 424]KAG8971755.1 hypothetical protein FRC05_010822 [Tulasnella sp. 425]